MVHIEISEEIIELVESEATIRAVTRTLIGQAVTALLLIQYVIGTCSNYQTLIAHPPRSNVIALIGPAK
jgi:hypothetical protein